MSDSILRFCKKCHVQYHLGIDNSHVCGGGLLAVETRHRGRKHKNGAIEFLSGSILNKIFYVKFLDNGYIIPFQNTYHNLTYAECGFRDGVIKIITFGVGEFEIHSVYVPNYPPLKDNDLKKIFV